MNTSAPFTASSRVCTSRSVANSAFWAVRFAASFLMTPLLSHITILRGSAPKATYKRVQEIAAAPAPFTTMLTLLISLPTISSALISAAADMIAVPCWSSCITGISSSSFRRRSISKASGALMSSRFIPPNVGAIAFTVSINLSTSVASTSISNTSIPANILNSNPLPSITGFEASAPMSPSPNTAVPLEITATKLLLAVYL